MKSKLCICFIGLSFALFIIFFACRKANSSGSDSTESTDSTGLINSTDPIDQTIDTSHFQMKFSGCTNAPDYGDTLIYPQDKGNKDYTIKPINDTLKGSWFAWPNGLDIDPTTGAIDVTQSETGVRYIVGFVKQGTHDTCTSQLVLAGVTYADSIYVLEKNDTLAVPYFNANPLAPAVCDASGDTDYPDNGSSGDSKCAFDVGPKGQKANDQKVRIRTISGVINLKKTLLDGAFGPNPKNGASKKVKIDYQLNDNSHKAMQKVTVQLAYYNSVSDIPSSIKNVVEVKHNNFFSYHIVNGRPRPPLLIITRFAN